MIKIFVDGYQRYLTKYNKIGVSESLRNICCWTKALVIVKKFAIWSGTHAKIN